MPVGLTEGLSLTREEIRKKIAYFRGWGRDSSLWSAEKLEIIKSDETEGLRQFYKPQPLPSDGDVIHKWTFLEPIAELVLWPDVAVSTATIIQSDFDPATETSLITASEDTFYESMVSSSITITGVGTYVIRSYETARKARVSANVRILSAATFSIASENRFALAPYVGGVVGDFWHQSDNGYKRVAVVPVEEIFATNAQSTGTSGYAQMIGITPTISHGKYRQQFLYAVPYPRPSAVHTLEFKSRFTTIPESDTNPFYPGAAMHAETILASCLAAAELNTARARGPMWEDYQAKLAASISIDRQVSAPRLVARMRDPSTEDERPFDRSRLFAGVTYNGATP